MSLRRLAAAALLCCASLTAQGDAKAKEIDWPALVDRAHHHRRYAMRRAVANKIAHAGAESVPALRAFAEENGTNAVGVLIVEAMANADTKDEPVLELLESWATDREFYWRAQALRGLANRGMPRHAKLFREAMSDPSHLMRIQGYRGKLAVGPVTPLYYYLEQGKYHDPDPRARIRLAAELALANEFYDDAIPALVRGLRYRDLHFAGDPWGSREAQHIVKVFKKLAKDSPEAEQFDWQSEEGIRAICAWAAESSGEKIPFPIALKQPRGLIGALEIRSCRNGDMFVRWSENTVHFGLDWSFHVTLAAGDILAPPSHPGKNGSVMGKVVCDFVRIQTTATSLKAAPGALPADFGAWIEDLGAKLVDSSGIGGKPLRDRLPQFVTKPAAEATSDR